MYVFMRKGGTNMKKKIAIFLTCFFALSPSLLIYASTSHRYTGEIVSFSHDIWIGGSTGFLDDNSFSCDNGEFTVTTRISKQTNPTQASTTNFLCYVYRKDLFGDTYVGAASLNRTGKSSASWKNMKHDDYKFLLTKENDGCVLSGSVTLEY